MESTQKSPLLKRLPMTRVKLFSARVLYKVLSGVLRKDQHLIKRNGINYDVDIAEGIDLSLFVFGNFQDHITNGKYVSLAEDSIIFDIGANIGSMALKFAQCAPKGSVYAFEPSDFAFQKLLRNLSLNPGMSDVVFPVQAFVSSESQKGVEHVAYASWRVDRTLDTAHPLHGGTPQPALSVPVTTIDDFCEQQGVNRIDLVKIDTEGYELEVLQGARKALQKFRPKIVFEIGLYAVKEKGLTFKDYFDFLVPLGYVLINTKGGRRVNLENYLNEIPLRFTTDIVALPINELQDGNVGTFA
jgi:FkbM family methyltransferase